MRPAALVDVFTRVPGASHGPHTVISVVYSCAVGGPIRLSHEGLARRYWPSSGVPVWHRAHHRLAVAAHAVWREWGARRQTAPGIAPNTAVEADGQSARRFSGGSPPALGRNLLAGLYSPLC
jgi:hypothetical protein